MRKTDIKYLVCAAVIGSVISSGAVKISAEDTDAVIRGDVNHDDTLDVFDLIRYKNSIFYPDSSIEVDYSTDLNGDNAVDLYDCSKLKKVILRAEKMWSVSDLPVMDGSTSAIPLEAGMKSKLLGIPYASAKELVAHHKTHESFSRLLSGENDLIFTVPISEEQKQEAEAAGVTLKTVPVAKEGFVFIVNRNNPVESLTQQQIRDIYSGKITNWKEVGGNDSEIIPYQRNKDSGSQNYMVDFMKDSDLMEPPVNNRILSMSGMIDSIAMYDNSTMAIGYSVYSYAAQMYENSTNVKFIAVDGIVPSRETMADSTYPLLSTTDIMYRDDASENTMDFINWAVSEEGQKTALMNGYVPAGEMEYPDYMKMYYRKGTGREKPDDYVPSEKISSFSHRYSYNDIIMNDEFSLNILKDKEFEETINEDIREILNSSKYSEISVYAENSVMSVEIKRGNDSNDRYNNIICLNYDLRDRKRIVDFSDLFFRDSEFIGSVNDGVSEYVNQNYSKEMRADFLGLTDDINNFSIRKIIAGNDIYVPKNVVIEYSTYDLPLYMITGEYFDLRDVIDESTAFVDESYRSEWNTQLLFQDGNVRNIIKGSLFHNEEEISKRRSVYEAVYNNADDEYKKDWVPVEAFRPSDYLYSMNVITLGNVEYNWFGKAKIRETTNICCQMFDPETGEKLTPADIFGEEFSDIGDFYAMSYPNFATKTVRFFYDDRVTETRTFSMDDICEKYIRKTSSNDIY